MTDQTINEEPVDPRPALPLDKLVEVTTVAGAYEFTSGGRAYAEHLDGVLELSFDGTARDGNAYSIDPNEDFAPTRAFYLNAHLLALAVTEWAARGNYLTDLVDVRGDVDLDNLAERLIALVRGEA